MESCIQINNNNKKKKNKKKNKKRVVSIAWLWCGDSDLMIARDSMYRWVNVIVFQTGPLERVLRIVC
jgi:hypothetical protein